MAKTNRPPINVVRQHNVLAILLLVLLNLLACNNTGSSYHENEMDFVIEKHDDPQLPFLLNIYKEIYTWGDYSHEKWSLVLRNRDDGSACYIHPVSSSDGIKKLFYLSHDTVRYVIDCKTSVYLPTYSDSKSNYTQDLSSACKNDGIDVGILALQYHEDDYGRIMETIIPDWNDTTTWRRTPVLRSERKAISNPELQHFMYMIAIDEKKNLIWIYDSNDSIVYRSPTLLKFFEEEPYMAKRHVQKVL